MRYVGKQHVCALLQIPFRYEPKAGKPPLIRTGYYFLPTGWRTKRLPIMLLCHGLAGFGGIGGGKRIGDVGIMGAGYRITFQVAALARIRDIVVAQIAIPSGPSTKPRDASKLPSPPLLYAFAEYFAACDGGGWVLRLSSTCEAPNVSATWYIKSNLANIID